MINSFLLTKPSSSQRNPLVSVIIGNYNYGDFLADAIESVFKQTYIHFELIVVDDGSTDKSREIIKSYGERIIPIYQSNKGQGEAFNAGIRSAKGEIICFLDADDYFHREKLFKIVECFRRHPQSVSYTHLTLPTIYSV